LKTVSARLPAEQGASIVSAYPKIKLYIDGAWRDGKTTAPILNPADESVLGLLPIAEQGDLDDALEAARKGFRLWSRTAPAERARVILKAAALMRERIEEIAFAITCEHGKPLPAARAEVIRGCEFFEWDAGEATRVYGRIIPSAQGIRYLVHHQPIGAVAAFSPWNFPMSQPARKIAGALAAGCSIIIKAAEETPGGVTHIVKAFHDAGLPAGVLNLVFGVPADISGYLIPREPVRMIAFTGSTAVGKWLTERAARAMKPVLMELGGHAPVIVCDDADAHRAGEMSAVRKARNSGQVCTSPTRFFVMESQYEAFKKAFVERARAIRVGNGLAANVDMGPVANERRIAALSALASDARQKGAKILLGGEPMSNRGYFFPVTVIAEAPDEAKVMCEEPFGPMAIINPVRSLDEAIARANALPFGLAAYAFTNSAPIVDRLTDEIECGNLSINTLEASVAEVPFGGVKESGYGREGGPDGLHHYMVVKTVSHRMAPGGG
jgi:succinate-semialdehyde dehydrogenase/glutarate-semialdehyde dehydrogenase